MAVQSIVRHSPFAWRMRISKTVVSAWSSVSPTRCSITVRESSGCTRSVNGRLSSSSGAYPSTRCAEGVM